MVTKKFDELYEKYEDATYILDRKIKVKLKEIIACQEECDTKEQEFTYHIIDKFCELIDLLEERNEEERQALNFGQSRFEGNPKAPTANFIAFQNKKGSLKEDAVPYKKAEELLMDFYNSFIKKKSAATMKDYVARIKTFAYSEQYLNAMLRSGDIGIREIDRDPVLFTYANIELILARFNTKGENGVAIKQKNNIRSALRLLNDFKREKEFGSI